MHMLGLTIELGQLDAKVSADIAEHRMQVFQMLGREDRVAILGDKDQVSMKV